MGFVSFPLSSVMKNYCICSRSVQLIQRIAANWWAGITELQSASRNSFWKKANALLNPLNKQIFAPALRSSTSETYWRYKEVAVLPWKYYVLPLRTHNVFFLTQEPQARCKSKSNCERVHLDIMHLPFQKQCLLDTAYPSQGNPFLLLRGQEKLLLTATTEPGAAVKLLASDWMNTNSTIIRNNECKWARQPATTVGETAELLARSIRQNT